MSSQDNMKKKYNIEIADVQLSILSDDPEDFVQDTVKALDTCIRDLTVKNKRCAKIDAAVLCALDFLGDKLKLEKKVKNLEAQIDLYEANIKRLKENTKPAASAPAPQSAPQKPTPAPKAPEGQLSVVDAPATPVAPVEAPTPSAPAPGSREDKLRQIELLMRAGGKHGNE